MLKSIDFDNNEITNWSDPYKFALSRQQEVQNNMLELTNLGFFGKVLYSFDNNYYIQFNAGTHLEECNKLARMFSKYPRVFLGEHMTEVQFDNICFTMTVNSWVKINSVPNENIIMDFSIEYYIHTCDHFPHTIFFRINKKEINYEKKIEFFIDCLLQRKCRMSYEQLMEICYDQTNDETITKTNPIIITNRGYTEPSVINKNKKSLKIFVPLTIIISVIILVNSSGKQLKEVKINFRSNKDYKPNNYTTKEEIIENYDDNIYNYFSDLQKKYNIDKIIGFPLIFGRCRIVHRIYEILNE